MKILEDIKNNIDEAQGVEKVKIESNYLRGTINESLLDQITGAVAPDDAHLIKLHGIYQQTDRELDAERKKQKLEPYYIFMARVRVPGGISTSKQWLAMNNISDIYANNTIKLTTRQAYQFHGVLKRNLKNTIKKINNALLDTLAASGDVNRNVMCSPVPHKSNIHNEVNEVALLISKHLTPKTSAYREIWLNEQLITDNEPKSEIEPIYTKHYLPRKLKIALAIPPYNDTDVLANDIGLIAIEEGGKLAGFNITVGGGMGNTIGNNNTYPRLGTDFGFVETKNLIKVIESIVLIQRDFGNREDRKNARLKYTIDRKGIEWFKNAIETKSGIGLLNSRKYEFESNYDIYGWTQDVDSKWHYGLFVENGRVKDDENRKLKSCLKDIATLNICDFRLTGNQNIVLGNIEEKYKKDIDKLLKYYKITNDKYSKIRLNSLACVALNTCSMAFAEAERYLPKLIDKIDTLTVIQGIENEDITIRMTGCPNGCARPYNAEIALVGRAPGVYNMYIGGNRQGTRLNRLYKEMQKEEDILKELNELFKCFKAEKKTDEHFGDFIWRKNYVSNKIPLSA